MRFGVFYELQLPRPWNKGDEHTLFHQALDQVALADRLGFDYAWEVEHHFLDEYSHSSAPEVFLAAAAARTKSIRLGHGIRQVIPNYNHPARTAECLATLDIISNGRVDFGIGEGATRMELGGFNIPAKEKRAMALEAAEQVANMMVLEPYPGFQGKYFTMPCRNVVPKPVQAPHPPIWMACTNRDTIKIAAQNGVGALAFSFLDPAEARLWADIYYGIIKSDACVPLGHSVNANIAMVSSFSVHRDRAEAIRRGHEGFEFFGFAINALVARDTVPGRTNLWGEYIAAARRPHRSGDRRDPARRRQFLRHRHAGGHAHASCRLRRKRRRPGHLPAAGRPQPPRPHLRSAGAVCRRGDARVQGRGAGAGGAQGRGARALHRRRAQAQAVDEAARRPRNPGDQGFGRPGAICARGASGRIAGAGRQRAQGPDRITVRT